MRRVFPLVVCFVLPFLGRESAARADDAGADGGVSVSCTGGIGDPAALVTAIMNANTAGGGTIQLGAGCTYTLTDIPRDGGGAVIAAALPFWFGANGLPLITSAITIDGNGATIARSYAANTPNFRLFAIAGGTLGAVPGAIPAYPTSGALALHNVTLQNGFARGGDGSGGGAGIGGALLVQGSAVLDSVTFTNNEARGGDGSSTIGGGGGLGGFGGTGALSGGGGFVGTGGAAGGGGGAFGNGDSAGGGCTGNASGITPGACSLGAPWSTGGDPAGVASGSAGAGGASLATAGNGGFGGGGGAGSVTAGAGGIGGGGGSGTSGGAGGFGGGGGSGAVGGAGGFGGGGALGNGAGGFGGGSGGAGGGGGGAGMGGAIFVHGGTLTVTNSTFAGNRAQGGNSGAASGGAGFGGAVFVHSGKVALGDSTLTQNVAAHADTDDAPAWTPAGGAIYALSGATTITSATIAQNFDATIDAGSSSVGGALYIGNGARAGLAVASVVTKNSIFSGSSSTDCETEITSAPTSLGSNLIQTQGSCGFQSSADDDAGALVDSGFLTTDILGKDPKLAALANNGGATLTMATSAASPGVSAGACTEATDQRGIARAIRPICDIGAYETGRLRIYVNKNGNGTVTSVPAGIACGETCTGTFDPTTTVTLTIVPDANSTFLQWDGACASFGASTTCTLTGAALDQVDVELSTNFATDAGTKVKDAGTASDAGVSEDASAEAGPANDNAAEIDGGGCGCDLVGAGSAGGAWALALAGLAALRARRKSARNA